MPISSEAPGGEGVTMKHGHKCLECGAQFPCRRSPCPSQKHVWRGCYGCGDGPKAAPPEEPRVPKRSKKARAEKTKAIESPAPRKKRHYPNQVEGPFKCRDCGSKFEPSASDRLHRHYKCKRCVQERVRARKQRRKVSGEPHTPWMRLKARVMKLERENAELRSRLTTLQARGEEGEADRLNV